MATKLGRLILGKNGVYQRERGMKKVENNLLTPSQFSKILILSVIAIGILSLPNEVVIFSKQDGWISVILGAVYPLYIIVCTLYIARRYPEENVLTLNIKFFGKFIGSIFNMALLIIHIFYTVSEISGISNFFRVYIVEFISSFRLMFLISSIAAFSAYKGLKNLGRISEVVFYNVILTAAIGILVLTKGSILNIKPVFGSGVMNIVKGTKGGIYAYAGMETLIFLYPYISDKKKLKNSCIKATGIICAVYTWVTFATIFYLGHRVIPKARWSTLYIIESFRVPIINNFRFVMMFLWVFVSVNSISINYYFCDFITRSLFIRVKRKIFYVLSVPLMVYISMFLNEEVKRREYVESVMLYVLVFNIMYIALMFYMAYVKKGKAYEKGS
jgi:spore germination protein (amino acid permease)